MDISKKKRNWVVVSFVFVFTIFFALETYAEQPADKQPLTRPLLHKLHGPRAIKEKLKARKAQAPKTQPPKPTKPACPPNCDELLEKARKYGSVRVIVGLNIPDLPDASRFPHAPKEEQRRMDQARKEAIAKAQERLLKRMTEHKITGVKKLEYTPVIGMVVDAKALEDLIANPEVRNIGEDIPVPPLLPQSIPLIGADQAWAKGFTGTGYTVTIIDTGVDSNHPFLVGKIVSEACFSTSGSGVNPVDGTTYTITPLCPNGTTQQTGAGAAIPCNLPGCDHGTHVAGIATGKGASFSGVAKDANIIAVQVFSRFDGTICNPYPSPCIMSFTLDQTAALDQVYALRNSYNIAASNMSLGGGYYTTNCETLPTYVDLKTKIDALRNAGIATIIASGNSGYPNALSAPACISTAVSVGATTKADTVASYSNSASFLHLLAPGGDGSGSSADILSSVPGGGFDYKAGTSMAAPHVSGAWAVMKSQSPTANVSDVLSILQSSGFNILDPRNNIPKPRIRLNNTPWVARYSDPTTSCTDTPAVIATDVSGNAYIAGEICRDGSCSGTDYLIIKYDTDGTRLWVARYSYGVAGLPSSIAVDTSGNVYVTGVVCKAIDIDGECQSVSTVTVKYDTTGSQRWAAVYDGGNGTDRPALAIDGAGNVYVTGLVCSGSECFDSTSYDYLTVKYDTNGNQLWVARHMNPGEDYTYAIAVDELQNVYVSGAMCDMIGTFGSCVSFTVGTIKYDTNGNELWVAKYGGSGEAFAVAVDNTGSVYVTGYGDKTNEMGYLYTDYLTIKYDSNGNQLWAVTYDWEQGDWGWGLGLDSLGNVYVAGSNYITLKYSSDGNLLWAVGGDYDEATALRVSGESIYVTGIVRRIIDPDTLTTKDDYVTVKYDMAGNRVWQARYTPNPTTFFWTYPTLAVHSGNAYVASPSCRDINCATIDYVIFKYTPD